MNDIDAAKIIGIGIDSGISGAVAMVDGNGQLLEIYDLESHKIKSAGGARSSVLNAHRLNDYLGAWAKNNPESNLVATIEKQHAFPGRQKEVPGGPPIADWEKIARDMSNTIEFLNNIVENAEIGAAHVTIETAGNKATFPKSADYSIGNYIDNPDFQIPGTKKVGPVKGVVASFKSGETYGKIVTVVCVANHIPLKAVSPVQWKNRTFGGVKTSKADSLRMARSIWPDKADLFKRVMDHDRAEAALIALDGIKFIWRPIILRKDFENKPIDPIEDSLPI